MTYPQLLEVAANLGHIIHDSTNFQKSDEEITLAEIEEDEDTFDRVVALIIEEQKCKALAKPSKADSYYLSVHDEAQHNDAELKTIPTPSQSQQTAILGIDIDKIPKNIIAPDLPRINIKTDYRCFA